MSHGDLTAGRGSGTCVRLAVSDSMPLSTTSSMGGSWGGSIHAGSIPEWQLLEKKLKSLKLPV